jgi:CHAT domain-containing protein
VRLTFAAKYGPYYHDCLRALLDGGRPAEALHILERSRARALLAMLAERDLLLSADVPGDVEQARRSIDTEYDRTQAALRAMKPAQDGPEIERLTAALRELQARREENAARILSTSPRFASLRYPVPLTLEGVRNALDPGTVWLGYSVGADDTLLFVVEPTAVPGSGLQVFRIPAGEAMLRLKVKAFRSLIERRENDRRLHLQARALYDLLMAPAEKAVDSAQRLVLSPDGPLHTLPFAALASRKGYLVERKPIHLAVSATVYAEIKKDRPSWPSDRPGRLTAFGDPLRGDRFAPLPGSRREVERIASLYAPAATAYLGEDATEERAKSVGKGTRYLHFACHAVSDERFPLDSALALTIPHVPAAAGTENGLLQAWEIFESLRIDADLVTLSACQTGLGAERGGEGLIGLTRAFQYAGARSVLASLWSVGDDSTAELMTSFYGALKAGRTKDEALRSAQRKLLGSPSTSHPFHWAALELSGDWR